MEVVTGVVKAAVHPVKSLIVDRIQDYVNSVRSYDANITVLVAELNTLCIKKLDIDDKVTEGKEGLQVLTRESANWLKRLNELIVKEEMKELMKEHKVAIIVVKMMDQRVMKKLLKDNREVFDIVVKVVMNKRSQEVGDEEEVDVVEDADYRKVAKIAMEVMKDTAEDFKEFMMNGEAVVAAVELLNDDEMASILYKAEGISRVELEHSDQDEVAEHVEPVNENTIKEKVGIWRKYIGSLMLFLKDEKFMKGLPHGAKFGLEVMDALSKKVGALSVEDNPERTYCGWCIVGFGGYRYCHDMSKRAEVMVKAVRSMIVGCPQGHLTRPKREDELEKISNEFMEGLESREELLHKILTALSNDQVNVVGVVGMGGSGKTMLAKEVAEKRASLLFDKRVWVDVSEVPNIKGIQDQIAEGINLTLNDGHSVDQRARRIYNGLKSEKKRKILVVLDNVWTKLKLNEVGIPRESNEDFCCKLLITTRDRQVCRSMDVQVANVFEVGMLNQKEAMNLFKNLIGKKVENTVYKPVVDRLLRKCGGLPLAIVASGSALRGRDLSTWFHFVEESDKLVSSEVSSEYRGTYSILETSYKLMDIEEKRIFFFLACLSPLDSAVSVDDMMRYGIGLGLFQRVNKLSEAMSQASGWVDELVLSSLLIKDDSYGRQVKIHDVVRASAISFAEKGMNQMTLIDSIPRWMFKETFEKFSAISLLSGHDFSRLSGVKAPLLEILLLKGDVSSTTLTSNFFDGMTNLKVLSLSNMNFNPSLPESIGQLEHLKTLHVEHCKLKDIKLLGKLVNLLVLSLRESSLEELSDELGELCNLRLLDMRGCKGMISIPANILYRLSCLEGLYMLNTFDIRDNDGGSNLNKLSHLSVLEMEVQKLNQLPTLNDGQLFEQLDMFRVYVGYYKLNMDKIQAFHRVLELVRIDINKNKGLSVLLQKCDFLRVNGCGGVMENFVPQLDEEGFKNLKYLEVRECNNVKFIVSSNMLNESVAFTNLELLCDEKAPAGLLSNLQFLTLHSLPKLMYVSPLTGVQLNLAELSISRCVSLKFIFIEDVSIPSEKAAAKKESCIVLPLLKSIALRNVANLSSVLGRAETIDDDTLEGRAFFHKKIIFPSLESLKLSTGGNFVTLWNKACHSPSFWNLTVMHIHHCTELQSLGTPSMFAALRVLEELSISFCDKLQEVITTEAEVHQVPEHVVRFPCLKLLSMRGLPIMVRFYGGSYNLEFPKLKALILMDTRCLTNFLGSENSTTLFSDKIELPLLEELKVVSVAREVAKLWSWSSICVQGKNECSSGSSFNPVPNLQDLCLGEIHGLMSILPVVSHNLSRLEVTKFNDIKTLFSISSENREAFLTYSQFPKLDTLSVDSCLLLENLFENEDDATAIKFCRQLTNLILKSLPALKILPMHLLENLGSLTLFFIAGLKYAFSADLFTKGRQQLQQLENLVIVGCVNMEVIIMDEVEGGGEDKDYVFPRLKSLSLRILNVVNFASNPKTELYFPSLQSIIIQSCHNIESFCSGTFRAPKLKRVELNYCNLLQCFLSENTNGVQELPLMESVHITSCRKLLSFSFKALAAPKLHEVRLVDCIKMKWFSPRGPNVNDILELPSLESVYLLRCILMMSFLPGQFKLPGLSTVMINNEDYSMRSNEELESLLGNLCTPPESALKHELDSDELIRNKRALCHPQEYDFEGPETGISIEVITRTMQESFATNSRHEFWETQPVGQFKDLGDSNLSEGPIEQPTPLSEVKQESYNLPGPYEWITCDMETEEICTDVYNLLTNNYADDVEDDEDDTNRFRLNYSKEFLQWALRPPGYHKNWHIGVRVKTSKELVAFITGIPSRIRVQDEVVSMAEINFLCVHKKLRSKRLAPVMMKEVTRRVHLENIWQAAYATDAVIPTPVATCQYWHRFLNPKKLIDVGFSLLGLSMTIGHTIKLFDLPDSPVTPGFRKMEFRDVPAVTKLLRGYLAQFIVAPDFNDDDVEHWLLPKEDVIDGFVVESPVTHEITDFCSFHTLPATILGNPNYTSLKTAYSYYNVATKTPLTQLMNDALIVAKKKDYDVFTCLDIMDNGSFLKELKFQPGSGKLHYYLYNYRLRQLMKPSEIGLAQL